MPRGRGRCRARRPRRLGRRSVSGRRGVPRVQRGPERRRRRGGAPSPAPLGDVDPAAEPEGREDHGEREADLGRGDGDDEQGEDRAAGPVVLAGRPGADEQDRASAQHELDTDEDKDGVAPGEHAEEADADEQGSEDVGSGEVDHGVPPADPVSGRTARETAKAATSAPRSSTDSSSKGQTQVPKRSRASWPLATSRRSTGPPARGSRTASRSVAVPAPTRAASPRWASEVVCSLLGPIGARVSMSAKRTRTTIAPT